MKFGYETVEGRKSLDRRIAKLVAYVNEQVEKQTIHRSLADPTDQNVADWAIQTIEQGIKNIAESTIAYRID